MPVTMKDIAALIGVSRQAVAAALEGNGHTRVSQETREKVLKVARELNYILGVVFIVRKSSPASKKLETTANC